MLIDWRFVGEQRLTEPFFDQSLVSIPRAPGYACRTSAAGFAQFSQFDCLEPSAFLFHSSRCGSTLVTQLLATSEKCVVISEASVIDSAINLCRLDATRETGPGILKSVVRALGQRRCRDEQHVFVKLDSWHITHLPLIRQVFPDTPMYFIYRHPAEILLSHRRQRGSQMVPGLLDRDQLGLDSQPIDPADLDGFCLKVLASYFRSAIAYAAAGLVLINYSELPELIWERFAAYFSISLDAAAIKLMQDRSLQHSKNSIEQFAADGYQGGTQVDAAALPEVEKIYAALERLRLNQEPW